MAHDALPPPPHDRRAPRWPGPRELSMLAAAFELSTAEVLEDAACVAAWTGAEATVLDLVARRHAWDRTVPPYYLAALRRTLRHESARPGAGPTRGAS